MPRTSLMMRLETLASSSCGSGAQSAVMKSVVCTARSATTCSYVRPSPITPTDFTGRNTAKACAVCSYQFELLSSSVKIASAWRSRSAYSLLTSPRMRTPRPGPGKGWRNTISRGRPSANPLQGRIKLLGRIDVHDLGLHVPSEGVHDLCGFVQPQQAVVDEHAGELLADGAVNQRRRDR